MYMCTLYELIIYTSKNGIFVKSIFIPAFDLQYVH